MAATATLVVKPLPRAGLPVRVAAWLRGLGLRRALHRLAGVDTLVLQGRVIAVRARPIRVCRTLIPAVVRCSRRFAHGDIDESLYDDIVTVLAQGLALPVADVERLSIGLWDVPPIIERIAIANGLPVMEAGRPELGEILRALTTTSTGTNSVPSSSAPAAGPWTTSTTS